MNANNGSEQGTNGREREPALYIGPWVGEFGVEILRWQGMARALARSRPWRTVIAATYPDRAYLYEDFCDQILPYRPPSQHALGFDCWGRNGGSTHRMPFAPAPGDVWLSPEVSEPMRRLIYGMSACRSEYRNFSDRGIAPSQPFQLLLHARATTKAGQHHKNWPVDKWIELLGLLPKGWRVASIGAKSGAHKIAGTEDLRGIPLDELAGYSAAARVVVGPSSGAIHFAMHSGAPVMTWIDRDPGDSGNKEDVRCNYYPQWNPFDVRFCCLRGWQPAVETIAGKIAQLCELVESEPAPVRDMVFGTKRSGHHGFIEWLARLDHGIETVHWNDCNCREAETYPAADFFFPTKQATPKMLQDQRLIPFLFRWSEGAGRKARLLSFEGAAIEKIPLLDEAHKAERLIFVLRDAPNTAASLKKGIPELGPQRFLSTDFRRIMEVYRGYLREALGKTNYLGELRKKTIFVSYNKWHMDQEYRLALAERIGKSGLDPDRGRSSETIHLGGFEDRRGRAEDLATLSRWRVFRHDEGFWNLTCDPELFELENEFHAPFYLMGLDMPTVAGKSVAELPRWSAIDLPKTR